MSSGAIIPPEGDSQWAWDAADQGLLDATLSATPAQRLAWLEEALQLAYACGTLQLRKARQG